MNLKFFSGVVCAGVIFCSLSCLAKAPWPSFEATALTGSSVDSDKLIGQPTLLIVTPSRDAAEATRRWVDALRSQIDHDRYRVRDVLAVNLPFFMSEEDAIKAAREAIPETYYDQTWLLNSVVLERELGIPRDSDEPCIVVLNREGRIVIQEHGPLTEKRLQGIVSALKALSEESD